MHPGGFSYLGAERVWDVQELAWGSLLWSCFCGRPQLVVGGLDLTPEWEWVPLPHLFLTLNRVAAGGMAPDFEPGPDGAAVYAFTESSDWLCFLPVGGFMVASSSYRRGLGAAPAEEFRQAVAEGSAVLRAALLERPPELAQRDDWPRLEQGLSRAGNAA